jgi:hypothetical protein
MSGPMNELVDGVARAILKVRFYDPEPDMYDSLVSFWLELDEDHWLDARQEAEAAIAAVRAIAAIVPKEPIAQITSAMAVSRGQSDEGEFEPLMDLLDFSGDNARRLVLCSAYTAAIAASPYNTK